MAMGATRWVQEPQSPAGGGLGHGVPPIPSLEVVYRTDPEVLASVLPPPLEPPADPRVHVRIAEIDLRFGEYRHHEMVAYFAVDARCEGMAGEYPLVIPIDMESAVSISREKYGEPKKLAEIELHRDGDHVEGRVTRQGVTFIEILGDVTGTLPLPPQEQTAQFWFKFLPAAVGEGFDAGPMLVRLDQLRTVSSLERVEGKLVLRDLPGCPVVDLPVLETLSVAWAMRSSENSYHLVGPVDAEAFAPHVAIRYR
jgi:acetoacetate decarboxylase